MNASTSGVPTAGLRAALDGAACGPRPDLDAGWVVLRNCALGGDGPRIGLVLLHAGIGVALVDFAPSSTDAVGRLRRALDARRFPAIFGGYPPVVRVVLPADRLRDLGRVLAAEFRWQPPLALAGGDAWVRTARAAIEADLPVADPERALLAARRRHGAVRWRAAALAVVAGGAVGALMAAATGLVPPRQRGSVEAGLRAGVRAEEASAVAASPFLFEMGRRWRA